MDTKKEGGGGWGGLGRGRRGMKAEWVRRLILPGVCTGLSFQREKVCIDLNDRANVFLVRSSR